MFPADYSGLVDNQAVGELVAALLKILSIESGSQLRENFLRRFALKQHLTELAAAIRSVETTDDSNKESRK
jgi:hypothetical protein